MLFRSGVLRDFLRFGADGNQDSAAQTRDARQLLQVLAAALPPGRAPQASFVQHEIQRLAHQPDDYLFHEFLASTNEPLYFREFVADVRSGAYPEERHLVGVDKAELHRFIAALEAEGA